jgi:hypothetical protein
MPWWVRAVAIIGIPGMLATYLVYIGAQEIPTIRRSMEQAQLEVMRNREVLIRMEVRMDVVLRQLQRICYATAKTDSDRDRCFD